MPIVKDGVLQEIYPPEDRWGNLGDWVPPRRGMDTNNWPDPESRQLFNNCYRIHLLQIMQKVAGLLGKDADTKAFEGRHWCLAEERSRQVV